MTHRAPDSPMEPSQVVYPGKAVLRTVIQVLVGLAAIAPFLVADLGLPATSGLVAGALGIAAALTRIMAIPAVDRMLSGMGLGAEPGPKP
jgi:hypothetical protein